MSEYPTGLPLHQIPKQGDFRKLILPPPGHCFIVADVDSQETKLMTDFSQDPAFMKIYSQNLDPHSVTAAAISGVPYADIVAGKHDKYENVRKAGKVTNLGKNYRMGHKGYDKKDKNTDSIIHVTSTLYKSAHVKWGLTPTEEDAYHWGKTWEDTYRGVIDQQEVFIDKAKHYGYAETLAGARFYIDKWSTHSWQSKSSAIMFPIQGSGAEMKYLAIAVMRRKFPELTFWGEIHDEVIYTYDLRDFRTKNCDNRNFAADNMCCKVKKILDNLPYEKAWGWQPKIPFTWSVSYGRSWGELEEVG